MTRASAFLFPLVLFTMVGCGVQGSWTLESVEPESAAAYSFAKIVLNDDGTYSAEAAEGSKMKPSTGKWEFADNKITFTMDDGRTRTYDADLKCPGTKLHLMCATKEGEEVKAIMTRE